MFIFNTFGISIYLILFYCLHPKIPDLCMPVSYYIMSKNYCYQLIQ